MAQAKSVNNFIKGLNLSSDFVNNPKGSYTYALNAIKEDAVNNPSILSNEKGFSSYLNLGYNYILIGNIYLGKEDYVFFIKEVDGAGTKFNRILLYRNGTISTKLDNINLGFDKKYPITGTYRINYKNEYIIYWVDGLNEDRFLNLDNGITINDLDQLSIDIKYIPAVLQSRVINDNDGSLKTGAYEFFGSYISEDNATTPWFALSGTPSYIIDDNTQNLSLSDSINVDGCNSGLITTKSIDLNLINLDSNFNRFRLGIIKTINGTSTAYYVDNISYTTSTKTIKYSGFAEEIIVSDINQFVVDPVRYYASNAIIQSNNRLLRANSKSSKFNVDYQAFANNISVDYYIEEELVMSMQNSTDYDTRSDWWKSANTKYSDKKSLMRDEVYSVGVAFGLIEEGIESPIYHIPGRALNDIPQSLYVEQYSNSTNPALNVWDTNPITENGETVPRWKVENTALLSTDGVYKKLAYWESEEVYPDGYNFPITGSTNNGIGTTNVRHHKMPSTALEPLYRREEVGNVYSFYKRNLGLKFNNIVIPDELKNNISYIRFYITPRTTDSNKSIVGKGIFSNCSLTKIDLAPGSGGLEGGPFTTNQWVVPVAPYNDLDDPLNSAVYNESKGTNTWNTTTNHYHSFYSPDTTLKNPILNIDRVSIENEIDGIVHYYDVMATKVNALPYKDGQDGNTSVAKYHIKRDIFYGDDNKGRTIELGIDNPDAPIYNLKEVFKPTYKSISILNNTDKVLSTKSRRKVKSAVYVPHNSKLSTDQLGGMDNPYFSPYGQGNVLIELDPTYSVLGATTKVDTSIDFQDNNQAYNNIGTVNRQNGSFHFFPIENPKAVYRYGSIKKTNPTQYGVITGMEYVPTDLVIANPTFNVNNTLVEEAKGLIGDSFIDLFSVQRTKWANKRGYTYGGRAPEVHVGVSTFFAESNINHRLRYAEGTEGKTYYPKQIITTPIKDWLNNYNDRVLIDNYYKYNNDYHKDASKRSYNLDVIDLDLQTVTSYPTRILYSEKLLDEERSDSYRVYLANNYKDLPKNRGFITHLFNKGQELFAVTRDSIWKLFASNQTIKTNSIDNITVGTGEFLSLEPIEVLSIEGGYAGSSSKMSLVETPYGYFYCDRYKGRFILFDNQQKDISLLGINEFAQENYKLEIIKQINELESEFDSPLSNYGYLVGYEPSTQRLLVTKLDYKFTSATFTKYKGIYNPATSYVNGDIYLKDGVFYKFTSQSNTYTTIYESSDLSSFTPSTVEDIDYTFSNPSVGTLIKSPVDNTKLIYTPVEGYVGTDTFNVTSSCLIEPVTVTIEDSPLLPSEGATIPEDTANSTLVMNVSGTYTEPLTYSIVGGDDIYGVFTINSSTGNVTVLDNSTLDYNIKDNYLLSIKALGSDGKSIITDSTIDITPVSNVITGTNQTVTILDTTASGSVIKVLTPATSTKESFIFYSVTSESTTGVFEYNFDDSDNLEVKLIDNASLDPSITSSYTITIKAEDNNNAAIYDEFTLTVNVLYDPDTLINEPGDFTCSTGIEYYNVELSQSFQKASCPTGESGTYVTYTVPANTYSAFSQSAADALAQNDIDTNGQTYANTNGTCLVNTTVSTLVVDLYYDSDLDVCAYIDTVGVAESNNIVSSDNNFYLNTDEASSAFILASDRISSGSLKRRFQFNIGKLIAEYTDAIAIPTFTFTLRGRSTTAGIRSGVYALKYPNQTMIMTGTEGSYIPSVSPAGGPTPTTFETNVISGANGTVGIGIGNEIVKFIYNRSLNSISIITY